MTDSYLYLLTKGLITLLFILGLIGLSLYALKRYMNSRDPGRALRSKSVVKVITSSFLGPKKSLTVVEVAGEMIVLGITPTSVNYLTKVEKPEAVEALRGLEGRRSKSLFKFFQT